MARDHVSIYQRRVARAGGRLDRSADDARRRARTRRRAEANARMLADLALFARATSHTVTSPIEVADWIRMAAWLDDHRRRELSKLSGDDRRIGQAS